MRPKLKLCQPPNLTLRGYIASKIRAEALRGPPVPPDRAHSSVGGLLEGVLFSHAAMDDHLMDKTTSGYRTFLLLELYRSNYSYRDMFTILECMCCKRELLYAKRLNARVKVPPALKYLRRGEFPRNKIITLGCYWQMCSECLT